MKLTLDERMRLELHLHHATDVSREQERRAYLHLRRARDNVYQDQKRQQGKDAAMSTGLSDRRESIFEMVRIFGRADNETLAKAALNNPDWRISNEHATPESMRAMVRKLTASLFDDGYFDAETVKTKGHPKRVFSIAAKANKRTSEQFESAHWRSADKMRVSAKRTTGVGSLKTESAYESYQTDKADDRSTVH